MQMRPYQRECLEASHQDYRSGIVNQLWVVPTGGGKTRVSGERAAGLKSGQSMVYLTHTEELVTQAAEAFASRYPDRKVAIEMAGQRAPLDYDIMVASVKTLGMKESDRISRFDPKRALYVAVDEGHHAANSFEYRKCLEYFEVLKGAPNRDPRKLMVLITATPDRHDGVGLESLADAVTYDKPVIELMREGEQIGRRWCPYLVKPKTFRIETDIVIPEGLSLTKGDWSDRNIGAIVNTPERNYEIARQHKRLGQGLPGIVFTADVKHSNDVADMLNREGIRAAAVFGDMGKGNRKAAIAAFNAGEIDVLCSCQVLLEGFDSPRATVAHMARPTMSGLLFRQMIGRIFRPSPSPEAYRRMMENFQRPDWFKEFCLVIDYVDVSARHTAHTCATIFGLPPQFDLGGEDVIEQVEEFNQLMIKCPNLSIEGAKSVSELKTKSQQVDLMREPEIPAEVRRVSKLTWMKLQEGVYQLCLKKCIMEARVDVLGGFHVLRRQKGTVANLGKAPTLKEAVLLAENGIEREEMILLKSASQWRKNPPTEEQCTLLHKMSRELKEQFETGKQFWTHAARLYSNGNQAFSKGGVSNMITRKQLSRTFK